MASAESVQTGIAALQRGDPVAARAAFERAVAGRDDPQAWLYLAYACEMLGDTVRQAQAAERVLATERRNLHALTMMGDLALARGDDRGASAFYALALTNAPPDAQCPPDLAERLRRAAAAQADIKTRYARHLDRQLADGGIDLATAPIRFREALAVLSGEQPVQLQQPTSFYYPGLAPTAFFDTDGLDWVARLEAEVPAMRAELEAVLADDRALTPYVVAQPGRPNRGHALLDDPRWSAFHLLERGQPVPGQAERCPRTMAALAGAPMPRIAGRSPMALFSALRPGTHIPPHHGMLNTRLICHVPLIVPAGCRLRVGNHVRAVEPGRALLFDDSMEHEAWNDDDGLRVVLLFEVWRPDLSAGERDALVTLFEAIGDYPGVG